MKRIMIIALFTFSIIIGENYSGLPRPSEYFNRVQAGVQAIACVSKILVASVIMSGGTYCLRKAVNLNISDNDIENDKYSCLQVKLIGGALVAMVVGIKVLQ